ncbi:MAG: futalosine hydrolase [Bacteroidales bacterium]|nr:futalosine hydrolase [Bacteroidales bacterium]
MINKVLICAATARELECFDKLNVRPLKYEIEGLVSGIGPVATVYAIMNYLERHGRPDLLVNIGIAGSYREDIPAGSVVLPVNDCFADLGTYEDGEFIPISRATFKDKDDKYTPSGTFVADEGLLAKFPAELARVNAVTVSTATGSEKVRNMLSSLFDPDIETMEGAAAYYTCHKQGLPCIGIRSVSNMVGPGDRSLWNIDLALDKLGEVMINFLNEIPE